MQAQANLIADYLANEAHQLTVPRYATPLAGQPWIIRYNEVYIGGKFCSTIHKEINRKMMIQKWTELFQLTAGQSEQCNWDIFFRSWKGRPQWKQQILTKYNARILLTGVNLRRRRHADIATCPECGENETSDHLFIWKSRCISETYSAHEEKILTYLTATTPTALACDIQQLISAAREGTMTELDDGICVNADQ